MIFLAIILLGKSTQELVALFNKKSLIKKLLIIDKGIFDM